MPAADDEHEQAATVALAAFRPTGMPEGRFRLVVVAGPDVGRSFDFDPLAPSRVLVGKSPACEFRLSDGQVSRRHVALELTERSLRVTDLGSTNGTVLDGVAIVDAYARGGEVVRLGSTSLRVDYESDGRSAALPALTGLGRIVGASTEMRRLYPYCQKLAASDVPLIIEGETGTGKEVLAESIHEIGPRAAEPYVVFDCTAVPPNLVESELFGHEKGSFTGAVSTRKGVFEQAHRGTLLIDEIGDLDLALQPKLLRALERGEVRRVGGDRPIRVEVRVLSATRRDLDREVAAGRFRDDLFHRLAVARVELPPLRKRKGDVGLLAQYFSKGAAIPSAVLRRWEDYAWPGNVRELRNAVARFVAFGELGADPSAQRRAEPDAIVDEVTCVDEPDFIDGVLAEGLTLPDARQRVVQEFERRYLARALKEHGDSVVKAAAASGIARRYFHLLKKARAVE